MAAASAASAGKSGLTMEQRQGRETRHMQNNRNEMDEELQRVRESFNIIDLDGSGAIDAAELGTLFKHLGQAMTQKECENVLAEMDNDGDNDVNFDEFIDWWLHPDRAKSHFGNFNATSLRHLSATPAAILFHLFEDPSWFASMGVGDPLMPRPCISKQRSA